MLKNTKEILAKKYYSYNLITHILIFLNIFINIKLIPMGKETREISYLICFIFNVILIIIISSFGGIVRNIEKILKFEYEFNVKDTGNFLTNESIETVIYLNILLIINIYIWIVSHMTFIQGIIIIIFSSLIPAICSYLINKKYVKIIKKHNRNENIKNTYKYS